MHIGRLDTNLTTSTYYSPISSACNFITSYMKSILQASQDNKNQQCYQDRSFQVLKSDDFQDSIKVTSLDLLIYLKKYDLRMFSQDSKKSIIGDLFKDLIGNLNYQISCRHFLDNNKLERLYYGLLDCLSVPELTCHPEFYILHYFMTDLLIHFELDVNLLISSETDQRSDLAISSFRQLVDLYFIKLAKESSIEAESRTSLQIWMEYFKKNRFIRLMSAFAHADEGVLI